MQQSGTIAMYAYLPDVCQKCLLGHLVRNGWYCFENANITIRKRFRRSMKIFLLFFPRWPMAPAISLLNKLVSLFVNSPADNSCFIV